MKSHGNNIMNKIYNPRNVKPPVPTDVDEADACMERFIRQKYQFRSLEDGKPKPPARDDPAPRDQSPEGSPPPLPPKPGRPFGFGLRSASSATNLHRLSKGQGLSLRSQSPPPPLPTRSASHGLDAASGSMSPASFESMMNTLRDMGFQNERRNAAVLRGLDGNFDKSVETLVRLGEGNGSVARARTPAQTTTTTTTSSTNPFDQLDSKPSGTQQTGQSYNPFDMPTSQPASAQPLEQSFQNLQVSQPLFPHSTGGYPQPPAPQSMYQPPSATPPITSSFTQNAFVQSPQPVENNPFFQSSQPSVAAPMQTPTTVGQANPFFTQAPSPATSLQPQNQGLTGPPTVPNPPRHANTMPTLSTTSPFGQPSPFQQPSQPQPAPQQPAFASHNPFQSMTAPTTPQSATAYQPQYSFQAPQPAQHLAPQPTGRVDKNTILSLYSFSPPQPPLPTNPQQQAPGLTQPSPFPPTINAPQQPQLQPQSQPSADFQSGSRNPFFTAPPNPPTFPQQQQQQHAQSQPQAQLMPQNSPFATTMKSAPPTATTFPRGHMSQQSVDINNLQNGRHSPDAFASLSARYG